MVGTAASPYHVGRRRPDRARLTGAPTTEEPVTEIPEHLLKRSKAAKSEKAGGPPPADDSGATSAEAPGAAPATTGAAPATQPAAAVPAEPTPEPPKPVPPYVAAHRQRKRVPVWALPLVVFLPIWALGFAGTMQLPPVEDTLLDDAAALYATGCASCHGGGGGGGVGYPLSGGEVLATFPEAIDQIVFIARGTQGTGTGTPYGDPDRPGGPHVAGALGLMPAFAGTWSLQEIEMVTFHERAILSGEDMTDAGYQAWMEDMRHDIDAGTETAVTDEVLEMLLRCANAEYTPGATGEPAADDMCPGPAAAE
jgi:mono/diheme cytochrome c family protein